MWQQITNIFWPKPFSVLYYNSSIQIQIVSILSHAGNLSAAVPEQCCWQVVTFVIADTYTTLLQFHLQWNSSFCKIYDRKRPCMRFQVYANFKVTWSVTIDCMHHIKRPQKNLSQNLGFTRTWILYAKMRSNLNRPILEC